MEPKLESIPEKALNGTQEKDAANSDKEPILENGTGNHSDKENDEHQKVIILDFLTSIKCIQDLPQKNPTPINGKLLPQKRAPEEGKNIVPKSPYFLQKL